MLSFLFASYPPALLSWSRWVWVAIAVTCAIGGIVVNVRLLRHRELRQFERAPRRRIVHVLVTTSIGLFVLLFFRSEGIPVLAARFWLALLAIGDVVWVFSIVRHFRARVPEQRRAMEVQQEKQRYLKK